MGNEICKIKESESFRIYGKIKYSILMHIRYYFIKLTLLIIVDFIISLLVNTLIKIKIDCSNIDKNKNSLRKQT